MKKFLKVLALVLVVAMMSVAFVACGDKGNDGGNSGSQGGNSGSQGGTTPDTPAISVDKIISEASLKGIVGEGKVYLTSIGLCSTAEFKAVLEAANWYTAEEVEELELTEEDIAGIYVANNELKASDVKAGDTVIMVLGASDKGLGAAGVNASQEIARATALVAVQGVNVVSVHVGGKDRRGVDTDAIIEAVVPHSLVALVIDAGDGEGGNHDGIFTRLCGSQVPLYTYSKIVKMLSSVEYLLNA